MSFPEVEYPGVPGRYDPNMPKGYELSKHGNFGLADPTRQPSLSRADPPYLSGKGPPCTPFCGRNIHTRQPIFRELLARKYHDAE